MQVTAHAWAAAQETPISEQDVQSGAKTTIAALNERFFRVRLDRLTPLKKRYLRAMAELGPGRYSSGAMTDTLDREVSAWAPARSQLISKGIIWSPSHGDTVFTVPLFDEFTRRLTPGGDWRTE